MTNITEEVVSGAQEEISGLQSQISALEESRKRQEGVFNKAARLGLGDSVAPDSNLDSVDTEV